MTDTGIIERKGVLSSSTLHIIAMISMLIDHMGAVMFPYSDLMRVLGRLAFPIYCFMLAEGFRHTSNAKKYLARLLIFGLISEIPFDMAFYKVPYWNHQSVYLTLSISLITLMLLDRDKQKSGVGIAMKRFFVIFCGFVAATLLLSDYNGFGVLMVVIFYEYPGRNRWEYFLQFLGMVFVNVFLIGYGTTRLGSLIIPFGPQVFALLALPLIWLYNGERGITSKGFKYFCYAFYPLHLLALGLWKIYLS